MQPRYHIMVWAEPKWTIEVKCHSLDDAKRAFDRAVKREPKTIFMLVIELDNNMGDQHNQVV